MSDWHGGKGSTPRQTNKEKFDTNWDNIFGKKSMKVTVFTAPHCVHCETVKSICKQQGYEVVERDIAEVMPNEWMRMIGFVPRSVPQVLVGEEYIGGASDFKAYVDSQ